LPFDLPTSVSRQLFSTKGIRENVINIGRLGGWILGCICLTREFEEIDPTAKNPL
jgi:hypothetical protein